MAMAPPHVQAPPEVLQNQFYNSTMAPHPSDGDSVQSPSAVDPPPMVGGPNVGVPLAPPVAQAAQLPPDARPTQPLMTPKDAFIVTMFDMFFTRGDPYDSVNITTFKSRFLAPFLVKTSRHSEPSLSAKRARTESIIDAFTRLYNQGWVLQGATVFIKTKFGDRQGQCVATGVKLKVDAVPTAASVLNAKLIGPIEGYPVGKRIKDFLGSLLIPTFADLYKLTHAGNKKSLSAGPKDSAMEHHIHRRRRRVIRGGAGGAGGGGNAGKLVTNRPAVSRTPTSKPRISKAVETASLAARVEALHQKVDKMMECLLPKEVVDALKASQASGSNPSATVDAE